MFIKIKIMLHQIDNERVRIDRSIIQLDVVAADYRNTKKWTSINKLINCVFQQSVVCGYTTSLKFCTYFLFRQYSFILWFILARCSSEYILLVVLGFSSDKSSTSTLSVWILLSFLYLLPRCHTFSSCWWATFTHGTCVYLFEDGEDLCFISYLIPFL